ncbi:MAG: hypothetical protein MJ087_04715 [Lachnospiraceae bacterium]|nr:hypothetical protein [Lachnospiraceae bacterium]
MLNNVIKYLAVGIIIGLIGVCAYPPVMPDLMKNQNMRAANVSASELTPSVNTAYKEKIYQIIDFMEENGEAGWTKRELDEEYSNLLNDISNADGMDGWALPPIGYFSWAEVYEFKDECAEDFLIDADMEAKDVIEKELKDKFTFVINENTVEWYCKKHKKVGTMSPYKIYEMPWCKKAESLFPGIGEWLKSVEENGIEIETEDGEKAYAMIDAYEGEYEKAFDGITLNVQWDQLVVNLNALDMYGYEELTPLYEELQKTGWKIDNYYPNGKEKAIGIKGGYSDYAPYVIVTVKEGKIARIDLTYNDYTKIDQDKVSEYQTALKGLFRKAGIDDSVKDVLNDKGKKENYKVYTKAGEKKTDYRNGKDVEFDSYMVSIYDIK